VRFLAFSFFGIGELLSEKYQYNSFNNSKLTLFHSINSFSSVEDLKMHSTLAQAKNDMNKKGNKALQLILMQIFYLFFCLIYALFKLS
jgi:hypothetical protein